MIQRPKIQAHEAVLALMKEPHLVVAMRGQPLPQDTTALLAILANEPNALTSFLTKTGLDKEHAVAAVEYYVKSVILFPGASLVRLLAHEKGASREQLRSHMRLLLIWLHPDKNRSEWQAAYARRVLDAWKQLSKGQIARSPSIGNGSERDFSHRPYVRPWIPHPVEEFKTQRSRAGAQLLAFGVLIIVTLVPDTQLLAWPQLGIAWLFSAEAANQLASLIGLR